MNEIVHLEHMCVKRFVAFIASLAASSGKQNNLQSKSQKQRGYRIRFAKNKMALA